MTLTLSIEGVDDLGNGMPTEFVLNRRGATIGRAPTCDWCLPDPQRYISSRHSEISFRDGAYWLIDVSTNGTYVNNSAERLQGEHRIAPGDVIAVGRYMIRADLSGSEEATDAPNGDAAGAGMGAGPWDAPAQPPADAAGADEWGDPQSTPAGAEGWQPVVPQQTPADSLSSGRGNDRSFEWGAAREELSSDEQAGWSPSHDASGIPHGGSIWEGPETAADSSSEWSSAAPDRPPEPSPTDIWGQIAEDNVVDWARGGFGAARERGPDPLTPAAAPSFGPSARPPQPAATTARPTAVRQRAPTGQMRAPEAIAPGSAAPVAEFLVATGVAPDTVRGAPSEVLARAGALVRALVAGLYVLVEARARAKAQLGAESTRLEFNGNNPIKFARSPEEALAQLLNPAERGFMDGERAVEDAFYDLQSHQMATLKAMQGALRATLDRFSPTAIRSRADDGGFLASILPGARDAALWQAYEREFSGVASGSDEAFMDVFAKEFKKAYEEQSRLARQSPRR